MIFISVVNVQTCYNIIAALEYQQGKEAERCAAKRSNIEPFNFTNFARMAVGCTGRKVQGYTVIQAFSPEELQNTPENVEMVNLIGCEFAARAFSGCPYSVITHTDSKSGHLHNHITVLNYELGTGKCITHDCRWLKLSRINDSLMQDYNLDVCNAYTKQADQQAYWKKIRDRDSYIWQEDLESRIMLALENAISPSDFAERLKTAGVAAKLYKKNGQPLKHMTFSFTGKDGKEHRKRGINMHLENECSIKSLTEVFKNNAAKVNNPAPLNDTPTVSGTGSIPTEKMPVPDKNETAVKAQPKTAEPKETQPTHVSMKKKRDMEEEERKKKQVRIQLLESQRKEEALSRRIQKLREELNAVLEAIDNADTAEQINCLEERESKLQQKIRELDEEYTSLYTKEKQLQQFLAEDRTALDIQIERDYQIIKDRQKQYSDDGWNMSIG